MYDENKNKGEWTCGMDANSPQTCVPYIEEVNFWMNHAFDNGIWCVEKGMYLFTCAVYMIRIPITYSWVK